MSDMEVDFPRGGQLAKVVPTKKGQKKRKKHEKTVDKQKAKKGRIDPECEENVSDHRLLNLVLVKKGAAEERKNEKDDEVQSTHSRSKRIQSAQSDHPRKRVQSDHSRKRIQSDHSRKQVQSDHSRKQVQSDHPHKQQDSQKLKEHKPKVKVVKTRTTRIQDPGFDFSLGMFSMDSMARIGKDSAKKASEANHESSEEDDELETKDEPDDESDEEAVLERKRQVDEKEARLREAISENATDFDRLLTGSANSSDLWIKYITYFLRDEKVKEARKIAERALSAINFREEVELFNVWAAYLNLEVMFGDEESLKAVFDRAAQAADSLKMHKQMARILAHHKKIEQLDEHFENMIKKFKHEDLDVWYQYGSYLYESERLEDARRLLQKALNSLSRKHHLAVLSRFAQMEYRFGDAERAKTMFEKILQTYPKKTDIWSVYMDMSLKHEGIVEARKLFQRAVSADLDAYRTRVFYEKWMKAEEKFGDAESLEMVEEHAKEFLGNRKAEQDEET
ncbi:Suf domain-containing protein [Aphelenchoides bicaudatus]|nr:Suf domain-containing protein [Aphelenchoides bicaudatus]